MIPSVVLFGPESTGKSSLGPRLAAHFGTVWVPEYGRAYCEEDGTDLDPRELVAIMHGHQADVRASQADAVRFLIQDTDPVMTAAWSMMLFGRRLPELDAFTDVGALYLLMDIDLPWVADTVRMFPRRHDQERFFALSKAELDRRNLPYRLISGDGQIRFARAVVAIEAALADGTIPS